MAPHEELAYWGALAPIEEQVLWYGEPCAVTIRLLDTSAELSVLALAAQGPPAGVSSSHSDQRDYLEWFYRLSFAIRAIRGRSIEETPQELQQLMVDWPDPLFWELRDAYVRARNRIVLERMAIAADPLPAAPTAEPNGGDSGAGISPDRSVPASVPLSSTTRHSTRSRRLGAKP